jgi:hypothetical protein
MPRSRETDRDAPYLEHLQLQDLIGHAGGDPWAVDDSLGSGSPTQINFLAKAFHQAAGSATAAEETFRTARQHFQEYNRENGEQPINDGAEVQRVQNGLHATTEQLGRIAADLEKIAAALAEARQTSHDNIDALNSNLVTIDNMIGYYRSLETDGINCDAEISQWHQQAHEDTAIGLENENMIRNACSRTLQISLDSLRAKDGYDLQGLVPQDILRKQDMATAVRDVREHVGADGRLHKTLTMLDGSRHELVEGQIPVYSHPGHGTRYLSDTYFDKNGNRISSSITEHGFADASNRAFDQTEIQFADGTAVTMRSWADGTVTGDVTTTAGKHGILPDEFFSQPIPALAGGSLSGLEKQAQRGIPLLSGSAMENVRAGAKWGGPAVGVATGLYNAVGAESVHDACVAAWTAAGATSGGIGTDLVVGLLAPELLPITATGANALGSWTFGYVGGIIGNLACLP